MRSRKLVATTMTKQSMKTPVQGNAPTGQQLTRSSAARLHVHVVSHGIRYSQLAMQAHPATSGTRNPRTTAGSHGVCCASGSLPATVRGAPLRGQAAGASRASSRCRHWRRPPWTPPPAPAACTAPAAPAGCAAACWCWSLCLPPLRCSPVRGSCCCRSTDTVTLVTNESVLAKSARRLSAAATTTGLTVLSIYVSGSHLCVATL